MKKKNKSQSKKTRMNEVRVDFGKDVILSGMEVKDGQLIFYDQKGNKLDPVYIEVGQGYQRESSSKGPKIESRSKSNPSEIKLDPNKNLQHFEYIFAVDTNSENYNNEIICIAVPIKFKVHFEENNWTVKYDLLQAFEFRNPKVNPELIGWQEIIERILAAEDYDSSKRYVIIVDSELGKLSKINKQEEPIIGEYYLPTNFELIYASSDTGKDNPVNKIIAMCDTTCKSILRRIKESNDTISKSLIKESNKKFFECAGYWNPPKTQM